MPSPKETLDQAIKLHRAGQLAPAAAKYREILGLHPAHFDALRLLGQIVHQQGNFRLSLELTTRALAIQPGVAALHFQRALSLRLLDRLPEAAEAFATAARLQPDLVEAHHQQGNVLKQQRRFPEAIPPLQAALRLQPENPVILLNLGVAYLETGDAIAAVAHFRLAVARQPERPEAHNVLGHALSTLGQLDEAARCFREALRLRPDYAPAYDNLGRLLKMQGRATDAVASFRAALAARPSPGTHSNLLLALNAAPDLTPAEIFAEHRRWAGLYADPLKTTWRAHEKEPAKTGNVPGSSVRRLRIGYVSPDLSQHAVAFFLEPVLAAHDRANFEIFCYANVATPDRVTARLQSLAGHWRDIVPLDDEQAAALVRDDRIDILVDLAGHTARSRLLVFARKPAPIQVTWLGYPNTTGLDAIDYRLTDEIADPRGVTDPLNSERLERLPGPFLCYRAPADAPGVNALPALSSGHVTFGCFNNFAKSTPAAIACWSQLLHAVPASKLLLKSRGLAEPETAAAIHARFAEAGIAPDRIELNGEQLSVAAHLALYHRVDIALDTFPYNGTTTTCEALLMGVPVVTLAGQTHVGRVGASLLTHLGSPEWIASSPENYIATARTLATDLALLSSVRSALRQRLQGGPLCDAPAFTRNLEAAYRDFWIRSNELPLAQPHS